MRRVMLLLLLAMILVLSGCSSMTPPESLIRSVSADTVLISAAADKTDMLSFEITLYFRFLNTDMLTSEQRVVFVAQNETKEKAIVRALLDGPSSSSPQMSPLFPSGVEVLSTLEQDKVLFVTFNEALLQQYNDEPSDFSSEYWKKEAPLRRYLAMAALVATLTETGEYRSIQVLVRGRMQVSTSMRLNKNYFLSGDNGLMAPLTRDETPLLTHTNTARLILSAWKYQSLDTLFGLIALQDSETNTLRPSDQEAFVQFTQAGSLIDYDVSSGSVSIDGKSAILCADLKIRTQAGEELSITAWPMRLIRENGIWKITYARLLALMQLK